MKTFFFVVIVVFAALAASVSAQTVAFTHVNVIPMDRERVLANQTVVVKNGLIVEIGDTKKVKLPKDALRIDSTGKYLIPGLVDMHTHLLSDSDEFPDSIGPDELRVMVANGVTTVRFMIGTEKHITASFIIVTSDETSASPQADLPGDMTNKQTIL
jgi:imidazolonepropionase-like amidohydrolase